MITFTMRYLKKNPGLLLFGIAVLTILALLLTLIPADYLSQNNIWSYDKIGHLLLFGSWTYVLGLYSFIKYPDQAKLWKIFLLGLIFGAVVELLQDILPINRQAEMLDFTFDAIGAFAAVILLKFFSFSSNS